MAQINIYADTRKNNGIGAWKNTHVWIPLYQFFARICININLGQFCHLWRSSRNHLNRWNLSSEVWKLWKVWKFSFAKYLSNINLSPTSLPYLTAMDAPDSNFGQIQISLSSWIFYGWLPLYNKQCIHCNL